MKPSRQIGPIVISALSLLGLLAGTSAAAALPHLDDANYEPTRALMAPLDRHLFPRVSLSETKGMPTTAEAISKYDTLLLGIPQMTANIAAAQQINPELLVFWKFNPVGFSGFMAADPCNDVWGVAFGRTGKATEECSFYAGHWAYFAGTTLSQGIGDTTLTATVGDGTRVTAGRYVVIYDAPAGSFKNAEHALVKSVNGNTVTFASRGYKSVALARAAGAIVAEHPVPGGANGTFTPEHWMYNMSTQAPADANGRQLIEIQADWLAANFPSVNNVRVDGIIFDTDSWSQAWQTRLDVDNDLVADGGWSSSDDTNHWGDGMERMYRLVRDRFPGEIVVGGDRTTRGYDTLSGTQMEGFPVSGVYHSANPEYLRLDEVFANYTLHLRKGPEHLAAFTETLSKTPTKLYPRGASPVPVGNAPFRFGFAATLLDDGYYAQEPLQISRDPWWDEFAVDVTPGSASYGHAIASNPQDETLTRMHRGWLGLPLGARERIFDAEQFKLARSLIAAGNLDNSAALTGWRSSKVTMSFDSSEAMAGAGSLQVSGHQVYAPLPYEAQVKTPAVALQAGIEYTLVFSVKADRLRSITIGAGGTVQGFDVPDHWVRRVMTFTATATGSSTINFNVGSENTPLWLDEVYLFEGNANVFMREFENGLVVVNATPKTRTVDLGAPYLRIKGTGQDPLNDGSEVTIVTIAPHDAAILVNPATPPRELSIEDVTVSEGDGTARFTVSLSGPSKLPVAVNYTTLDGSALAGADYTAVAGTLSFAPGETARTVEVPVLDDLLHEPTESFTLVLSAASGAALVRDTATGTITDNDPMPGLSVADVTVSEGDGVARFAVSLSAPSALPVTLSYATLDGSARSGADYTAVAGTLSFAPGETARTLEVPVLDDLLHEPTESFSLVLSAASGAALVRDTATGTITDNDPMPGLSVADVTVSEGDGTARFAVSLSAPSALPVTLSYATRDGSARAGADYTAVSGTLSFAPGETARTVEVPVLDDLLHEPTESFSLVLSAANGAALVRDAAVATILDDDEPASIACGTPSFAPGSEAGMFLWQDCATKQWHARVAAGGSATVMQFTGSVVSSEPFLGAEGVLLELPWDVVDTSDPSRMTYRLDVVRAGLDGLTFSFAPSAKVCFSLDGPAGAQTYLGAAKVPMPASFDLTDFGACKTAAAVELSFADVTVNEADGLVRFPVTLSTASLSEVTVSYSTADGSALAGSDYVAVSGTLVFAPGETLKFVEVPVIDDHVLEDTESFALVLSVANGAALVRDSAVGTILDDDMACGTPSFAPGSEAGMFLWQDCVTKQWHARVAAGGSATVMQFTGSVVSSEPFLGAEGVLLELPWDLVDTSDPSRMTYRLDVRSAGIDGLTFSFAPSAQVCFSLDGPAGAQTYLGAAKVPMPASFDLTRLQSCN